MKSLLIISLFFLSTLAYSQGMKITWNDADGREFALTTSGDFSYSMIQGDRIGYDLKGRVDKIGSIYIYYDLEGRVSRIHGKYGTYIYYDLKGRVSRIGDLWVYYDSQGRFSRTSGSVNFQ